MTSRRLQQPVRGKGNQEQLARALRENLKRRKRQARRRNSDRRPEASLSRHEDR